MNPNQNLKTKTQSAETLQFLASAIATAQRSGAASDDIYRVVDSVTTELHGSQKKADCRKKRKRKTQNERENVCNSSRLFRFVFLMIAAVCSVAHFISFHGTQLFSFEKEVIEKKTNSEIEELTPNSTEEITQHGPMTLKSAIEQHDHRAISQFLLGFQVSDPPIKDTACPLDMYFNYTGDCVTRNGGTVCVFPGAVLKMVKSDLIQNELDGFRIFSDTKLFPELYYGDKKCRTVLEENVAPGGEHFNIWCGNYTYFADFYKKAFDFFFRENIFPKDLNTCCNTLVRGDQIRIIDTGLYKFDRSQEYVQENGKELLEKILSEIPERLRKSVGECAKEFPHIKHELYVKDEQVRL